MESEKIKLLKQILSSAEAGTKIKVNGFYSEPRIKAKLKDFLIPFQTEIKPDIQTCFSLEINENLKLRLAKLIAEENTQFLFELKHFTLEDKEILVCCFDCMEAIFLKKDFLPSKVAEFSKEKGLRIEVLNNLKESDFKVF